MTHWHFITAGCFAALVTTAHNSGVVQGAVSSDRRLEGRILAGDLAAVQEAERSDDQIYVTSLMGYLRSATDRGRPPSPPETVAAGRQALTNLITTRQLQAIVCQSISDEALMPVSDGFRVVGGWFGIRGLQMMLMPEAEARWHKAMRKTRREKASDVSYMPPRFQALQDLARVVADPPLRPDNLAVSPAEMEAATSVWVAWISLHTRELEKLKPTGEGVAFTEQACRRPRG